eukprot:15446006-Alexandrium_andersonii.AAC.1
MFCNTATRKRCRQSAKHESGHAPDWLNQPGSVPRTARTRPPQPGGPATSPGLRRRRQGTENRGGKADQ